MDEKIEKWPLRFPAKENPNKQKELFDWPIVLQYDVKAKYRLISRKFSGVLGVKFFHLSVRLTNQKPREFVSGSINQSNRSIYVRLLFLFCSRIFISRSYENRSNGKHCNFERFVQRQYTLAEKCFSRIVMYIPPMSDSSLWLLSTALDFWEIIILKSAPTLHLI